MAKKKTGSKSNYTKASGYRSESGMLKANGLEYDEYGNIVPITPKAEKMKRNKARRDWMAGRKKRPVLESVDPSHYQDINPDIPGEARWDAEQGIYIPYAEEEKARYLADNYDELVEHYIDSTSKSSEGDYAELVDHYINSSANTVPINDEPDPFTSFIESNRKTVEDEEKRRLASEIEKEAREEAAAAWAAGEYDGEVIEESSIKNPRRSDLLYSGTNYTEFDKKEERWKGEPESYEEYRKRADKLDSHNINEEDVYNWNQGEYEGEYVTEYEQQKARAEAEERLKNKRKELDESTNGWRKEKYADEYIDYVEKQQAYADENIARIDNEIKGIRDEMGGSTAIGDTAETAGRPDADVDAIIVDEGTPNSRVVSRKDYLRELQDKKNHYINYKKDIGSPSKSGYEQYASERFSDELNDEVKSRYEEFIGDDAFDAAQKENELLDAYISGKGQDNATAAGYRDFRKRVDSLSAKDGINDATWRAFFANEIEGSEYVDSGGRTGNRTRKLFNMEQAVDFALDYEDPARLQTGSSRRRRMDMVWGTSGIKNESFARRFGFVTGDGTVLHGIDDSFKHKIAQDPNFLFRADSSNKVLKEMYGNINSNPEFKETYINEKLARGDYEAVFPWTKDRKSLDDFKISGNSNFANKAERDAAEEVLSAQRKALEKDFEEKVQKPFNRAMGMEAPEPKKGIRGTLSRLKNAPSVPEQFTPEAARIHYWGGEKAIDNTIKALGKAEGKEADEAVKKAIGAYKQAVERDIKTGAHSVLPDANKIFANQGLSSAQIESANRQINKVLRKNLSHVSDGLTEAAKTASRRTSLKVAGGIGAAAFLGLWALGEAWDE